MIKTRETCDPKHVGGRRVSHLRRVWVGTLGGFCAVILSLCPGCHRKAPKPSDLTICTRLEIRYVGGALRQLFPDGGLQKTILNEEERTRVRSYDTRTVTDQDQIKALARLLSQDGHQRNLGELPEVEVIITGYRGRYREVTLGIRYTNIGAEQQIKPEHSPDSFIFDPPELQSLRIRWSCCFNMGTLDYALWLGGLSSNRLYPDPNHWCDTVAARIRIAARIREQQYPGLHESDDGTIARLFICPSIQPSLKADDTHSEVQQTDPSIQISRTWISTYAVNPDCRKDSSPDTVFLFESKPGWNQHGGSELFTFDHHDPKGGLVRLKDGTAKFVRTEGELKQLRWK